MVSVASLAFRGTAVYTIDELCSLLDYVPPEEVRKLLRLRSSCFVAVPGKRFLHTYHVAELTRNGTSFNTRYIGCYREAGHESPWDCHAPYNGRPPLRPPFTERKACARIATTRLAEGIQPYWLIFFDADGVESHGTLLTERPHHVREMLEHSPLSVLLEHCMSRPYGGLSRIELFARPRNTVPILFYCMQCGWRRPGPACELCSISHPLPAGFSGDIIDPFPEYRLPSSLPQHWWAHVITDEYDLTLARRREFYLWSRQFVQQDDSAQFSTLPTHRERVIEVKP